MSRRYTGGVISATAPTTSGSAASGIWTLEQQMQAIVSSGWPQPTFSSFTAGTQANADAFQMQRSSVAALSSTSFIYAYVYFNTATSVGSLNAVVATISGTTITFGTSVVIRAGLSPQSVCVTALSSTSALITYPNASSYWAGTAVTISGTTITAGSETANGTLVAYDVPSTALTNTTALVLCNTTLGIKASVATVSGTAVTWGTTTTSMSLGNTNAYATTSSGSSTKGVVAYIAGSSTNSGKPCAIAMTISGTTVSFGSETVLDASQTGTIWQPGISSVTDSSSIFAYGDNTTGYLKTVGMTVSGTTITVGTASTLTAYDANPGNSDGGPTTTKLNGTQALVVTRNASDFAFGQILTISGTSVTSSATSSILGSAARAVTVTYLGSGVAVAGYGASTTNISAKVLTLA
jgi:hypothetical protein